MKPDYLEKLNLWFLQEMAAVKAEGASDKDFEDPAVADLARRKVFEEHFDEIEADVDLADEAFAAVSDKTSPLDLRKIAVQARDQGNLKIGHYLELIADYREAKGV